MNFSATTFVAPTVRVFTSAIHDYKYQKYQLTLQDDIRDRHRCLPNAQTLLDGYHKEHLAYRSPLQLHQNVSLERRIDLWQALKTDWSNKSQKCDRV